ncbi:type II toxin-antitoxin system RelE/ParE family toxin [Alcanivorax sp. JB21]|uniref:type II toxin-antitoxin system RelE/ParE family toxin n=1 Tax=Alcanivorax limicola TaxID=2874102 RepID=UPI001CC19A76|nr:type II toxin-antitoxin system RelE/ParE family toxin [Alcanivorax limicola]MBZ2188133.1 type II toxin-antitoxin system RelE/ParE family toxin [Alcanivorax limicola]
MWRVETTDIFDRWFDHLDEKDRVNVLAGMLVLSRKGPMLSRPYADTVKGSEYSNMKELRIQSKGVPIRAFFAFDPQRSAILLCAGKKSGRSKRFYDEMILLADRAYRTHLRQLDEGD